MTYQLHHGNCLDIMPMMDRESIDAIVTDPPYGLGFMGKDWDHGVPGEHFWREAYRVAKPGAHLLAFGGTRTYHRLTCAIEDAGWEIRDCVMWVYGSGFPKSHDASKAIDKEAVIECPMCHGDGKARINGDDVGACLVCNGVGKMRGAERETIGIKRAGISDSPFGSPPEEDKHIPITAPATPAAQQWQGWGTALKPAWEPIIVARKPLAGTVAENVQRYGCGALNIDGCRIEAGDQSVLDAAVKRMAGNKAVGWKNTSVAGIQPVSALGRWPANLIHDGSAEVLAGFPMTSSGALTAAQQIAGGFSGTKNCYGKATTGGTNEYTANTGSAARFFYCAKASKADRDEGCEDVNPDVWTDGRNGVADFPKQRDKQLRNNHHPTVKPTALMRYLCRLVTPPQGVILDPFMGSGSTGKAAILEGFNFVGIDTEQEYIEIAARRIEYACGKMGIVVDQPMLIESRREVADKPKQMILL